MAVNLQIKRRSRMGNINNLIDNNSRTPSERRENAKKAGLASGESRRKKKYLQEALQKALKGKYDVDDKNLQIGGYDALAISMVKEAVGGNVKAFVAIRDTIGEKPKDTIEFEKNENQELLKQYLQGAKDGRFTKG